MKKKIISAILMSTVVLSAAAPLSGVYADTNSDIAKQDATISSAQSAKAQAQAQVDSYNQKLIAYNKNKQAQKLKLLKSKVKQKRLTHKLQHQKMKDYITNNHFSTIKQRKRTVNKNCSFILY